MKRSLLAFSLFSAAIIAACGADPHSAGLLPEDIGTPTGGTGGTAGTSGSGGTSGSAGKGGSSVAGAGGAGGTGGAGAGGTPIGGTAGASGTGASGMAGASGSAGTSGAAGAGAPGGAGGIGGTGGVSGTGGVGGAGGGNGGTAGASGSPSCTPAASGVEIAQVDPYGWPPYAIDGCQLVYVAVSSSGNPTISGELRLRDLATGKEQVLAPEAEAARRPGIAGGVIAWEATIASVSAIRVLSGGTVLTVAGAFDHAGEPRVAADGVVFTGFSGKADTSDTEVFLYEPSSSTLTALTASPGQQRWADISSTKIAWTDFSEDPDGTFDDNKSDIADIVLYDRATKIATPHPAVGKEAFPILTGDVVAYLHWPVDHPEPKLGQYELRLWPAVKGGPDVSLGMIYLQAGADGSMKAHARPAGRDGIVAWVGSPTMGGSAFPYIATIAAPTQTKANVNLGGADAQAPLILDGAAVVSGVSAGKSRLYVGTP